MDHVIETRRLTKYYGSKCVVDSLDLLLTWWAATPGSHPNPLELAATELEDSIGIVFRFGLTTMLTTVTGLRQRRPIAILLATTPSGQQGDFRHGQQ